MKKGRIKKSGATQVTFDVVAGAGQVDDNLTGTSVTPGISPENFRISPNPLALQRIWPTSSSSVFQDYGGSSVKR